MKPMVSVIIPTYNRAALVQRAIQSVLAQSHEAAALLLLSRLPADIPDPVRRTLASISRPFRRRSAG